MINIIITHLVQDVLPLCSQQVEVPACPQAWGGGCSCDQFELLEHCEETLTGGPRGHPHDDDESSGGGQSADEESSPRCTCQPDCSDAEDEARPATGSCGDVGQSIGMAVKRLVLRCRPGQRPPKSCRPPHVVSHSDSWSEYTYENPGWRAWLQLPDEECSTQPRGPRISSNPRPASKAVTWRLPPQRRPAVARMSQPRCKRRRHLPLFLRLHSCEGCLGMRFCHVDCDVHTAV